MLPRFTTRTIFMVKTNNNDIRQEHCNIQLGSCVWWKISNGKCHNSYKLPSLILDNFEILSQPKRTVFGLGCDYCYLDSDCSIGES